MKEKVLLKDLFDEAKKKYPLRNTTKHQKKVPHPTGFFNVKKIYCKECTQGYTFSYCFVDKGNKKKYVTRTDFLKLKKEVLLRDLPWGIVDRNLAYKTAREVGLPVYDLK